MCTLYEYDGLGVVIVYGVEAVICLLGLVGNVLSIIVWSRPQLKSSSAVLLTALGCADTAFILSIFPYSFLGTLHEYMRLCHHSSATLSYFCNFILPFMVVWGIIPLFGLARIGSIYLTITMTLERFIAVCFPFDYKEMCSYNRACKITAAIAIFSGSSILLDISKTEIYPQTEWDGTVTGYYFVIRNSSEHKMHMLIGTIITYILPLLVIIICNSVVWYKLKMASRARQGITGTDHQGENKRVILYVVSEFFICHTISAFVSLDITYGLTPDRFSTRMIPVEHFFQALNPSINFVTYIIFGKPFRKTLANMFCSSFKTPTNSNDLLMNEIES